MKSVLFLLLAVSLVGPSAEAFQFLKCKTLANKAIWGTFSRRVTSGQPAPVIFPSELIFINEESDVQLFVFPHYRDTLATTKVIIDGAHIKFAFLTTDETGETVQNLIDIKRYSPRSESAYSGVWMVGKNNQLLNSERTNCGVFQ